MLNGIKNLINQKSAYVEAAGAILEDASGVSLDDLIVLGEEGEAPVSDSGIDESGEDDEINNEPVPATEDQDEPDTEEGNRDVPSEPTGDNVPTIGTDDIPTSIGAQTGEPVADNIDDLLHVDVNLKSNTISDVLPVPPANAGEAIASDDFLDQRIDSGFGDEEGSDGHAAESDDFLDTPMDDEPAPAVESDNPTGEVPPTEGETTPQEPVTEAITLDDSTSDNGSQTTDSTGDPAPDEGGEVDTGGSEEENDVTAAVRDKVAEADNPGDDVTGTNATKDDLLKKLGNITKSLEDAKKAIMDKIQ